MNETIKNLIERRSVRSFKPDQIEISALSDILEAGKYAPTGRNRQTPVIIAVRTKADRNAVMELNKKVRLMPDDPYYGAPTIILVLAAPSPLAVEDGSLAIGNMLNAAHSLGIDSCWIHGEREMFDDPDGKALLKRWGIDEELIGIGSLAIGYRDCEYPEAKPRKENYTYII